MNKACEECGGACCEGFVLNVGALGLSFDVMRWLQLHGQVTGSGTMFDVPCKKLTPDGLCGVYDERPGACRKFSPGNPLCLMAIERYRPERLEKIRGLLSLANQ